MCDLNSISGSSPRANWVHISSVKCFKLIPKLELSASNFLLREKNKNINNVSNLFACATWIPYRALHRERIWSTYPRWNVSNWYPNWNWVHQISFWWKKTKILTMWVNFLHVRLEFHIGLFTASKLGPHILGEMFQIDTQIWIECIKFPFGGKITKNISFFPLIKYLYRRLQQASVKTDTNFKINLLCQVIKISIGVSITSYSVVSIKRTGCNKRTGWSKNFI